MIGLIGLRIREQRKQKRVTQAALAKRVGISPSYMNLIEADKRAIGGTLLQRIAAELQIELDVLTGNVERRLAEHLLEAAADPEMTAHRIDPTTVYQMVSRHPGWARAFLALWRDSRRTRQQLRFLEQRLDQDPAIAATIHDVLTHAATIRSTSEVLNDVDDLTPAERERFVDILLSRSSALSTEAEGLIALFEASDELGEGMSGPEEVDDLFIGHNFWFPGLEQMAETLRSEIFGTSEPDPISLHTYITDTLKFSIQTTAASGPPLSGYRQSVGIDPVARSIRFRETIPVASRNFQLARLAVSEGDTAPIEDILAAERLSDAATRQRARSALVSHAAAALLMPYEPFLNDAEVLRYDVERLCQRYGASVEQVCLRLTSLRKPGREGLPLGLLRADASGFISKRLPLPGLPLPGTGTGCPLWPIYAAHQTPGRFARQLAEFPNGGRFLLFARTLNPDTGGFEAAPVLGAIMLACDVAYADRTVFADGLALGSEDAAIPVGPTCRLCTRTDCRHRNAESLLVRKNVAR